MSTSAFERYAPFIQEYIYRKKWTDLREVQVEACEAILDTDNHVIVASGTASGKTEAAFFPMLTLLEKDPSSSIGVIYIGPLKALINDQFERLNDLLEEQDIPVWPWHGDVSQHIKEKVLRRSKGILQITPESLESLIMRHPGDAKRLFSDLRFIVIDEIHALMGEDRGLQVLCLIAKLEKIAGCNPRRIGLSATLNDYQPAMDFLTAGSNIPAAAVGITNHKRTISLCVESFIVPEDPKQAEAIVEEYTNLIYNASHLKKCLIFTNSRARAEELIASMKFIAKQRKERDVFHVHHGSISAALRKETEHALRDNDGPTVAAATLTLELGIDIGDLDSTIQAGAPYSCSSFVQRLGRSGRRNGKSQMMFVNLIKEDHSNPLSVLPWDLMQSIAIIQLYLEERWVENTFQKKKPYSLLAHQTLSMLMMKGELTPADLARNVLLLPAFKDKISLDEYRLLLRHMLEKDYIQRLDNGSLIVGLKGERITNHYSFYAVFPDEEAFHVISKDGEVGTLSRCPAVGAAFVLGGRSWQVTSIDESHKKVYVSQVSSSNIPMWQGKGGELHTRIVKRMKQVLLEDTVYPYLQSNAIKILQDARTYAREQGILERDVIPYTTGSFFIAPWVGTREITTITNLLTYGLKEELGIRSAYESFYYLQVNSSLSPGEFVDKIKSLCIEENNPDMVLPQKACPIVDKYDEMVPDELLKIAYLNNHMEISEAVESLKALK